MDSEERGPSTALGNCCDCACSSSLMSRSFSGTWLRNVKRKFHEYEELDNLVIPGFNCPHVARVEIGNECVALREMVSKQQRTIQDLSVELEEERDASASAAKEAMSMILRLQREKAEIQMEARQFRMFTEERMAYDQQELADLEELLYKKEQAIQALTCEVQAYKHRMMSYGLSESEVDGDRGGMTSNNSVAEILDSQFDFPTYAYPPLKCSLNENPAYSELENNFTDDEKYAFNETPRSQESLKDLEYRINQLERSPRQNHLDGEFPGAKNMLEKVIVGQSPRRSRHFRTFSTDSSSLIFVTGKEMGPDFGSGSPRLGSSFRKMEYSQTDDFSNLKRIEDASETADDVSDRVYTIDSVHQGVPYNGATEPKAYLKVCEDYVTTPRESLNHTDFEDPEMKKLCMRLQALEADRESMKQALLAMRTDKAQLILLKEIAQHLCKEMSPGGKIPVKNSSFVWRFTSVSVFKWISSIVFWRKKARQSKYMPGGSAHNGAGLQILLDYGPGVGQQRCVTKAQV